MQLQYELPYEFSHTGWKPFLIQDCGQCRVQGNMVFWVALCQILQHWLEAMLQNLTDFCNMASSQCCRTSPLQEPLQDLPGSILVLCFLERLRHSSLKGVFS